MKDLSATLLASQKKPDRLPYVEAKVYDFEQGIKRLSWERLYEGSEDDNHHGIAFDGQGSMHRIRAEESGGGGGGSYGTDFCTGGAASADSEYSAGWVASNAFDDNEATGWNSTNTAFPHWIKYDLGGGITKKARKLRFKSKSDTTRPKDFKLQGSNNDSTWTDIISETAADNDNWQEWEFANSTAYRYYRIYITSNYAPGYYDVGIMEIELMEWISSITYSLYRQKITSPDENSDYTQWTLLANDCAGPCAIAAYGAKVYIFYQTTGNVLWKYYSHDYGQSWNNAQLVDYADVLSMAATWWSTGNIVVCFALKAGQQNGIVLDSSDQSTSEHTWLGSVNHPFSNTFGIGASYTPDHVDIVIAALEASTPYNLYGLYRQQFDNTYTFTDVDPFITAPQGEDITYEYPDCHNPESAADYENTQLTAVEKYSGTTAYTRPLTCHAVRGSAFSSMAFTEPRPFLNISSAYGLRLIADSSFWWLERPDGVWRAPRPAGTPLDLTQDILSLNLERRTLNIELNNSSTQYATPPAKRSEVVLKLGYRTSEGSEAVEVGRYWIDSWEYSSSPNSSLITLHCLDGQGLADKWSARFQMRWPANKRVWEIIQEVICRWGINLISPAGVPKSSAVDNLYPDFTIQPGTQGTQALNKLLSFVPDALIFDGYEAYVKDLQDDEASSYSYGTDHVILQGEYSEAVPLTRARAIGRDDEDNRIVEDAFDWPNLELGIDNLEQSYDPNLQSATRAQERADAILRRESLRSQGGQITIPLNCGQEPYDVITVTDARCGISGKKYRVLDIETVLSRHQWFYHQRFTLGAP